MRAQRHGLRVLRVKALDDLGPQHARRAHLGNLHEVVHADAPEEAQTGSERVDIQPGVDTRADVLQPVGQRISQFQVGARAGFLHVVSADRNAVEPRHVLRRVAENVADNFHRMARRIDVRVADHEFLQYVVLNGSVQVLRRDALLFRRHNIERHDRQYCAVHGHRHRHLSQRDLVEEDFHIFDRVDRHAGLAHVAGHALVIGIVAAVRRQVEGYRKPFLSGR